MKQTKYTDSDGQILDLYINGDGDKFYFNSKNELHRLDGPAEVCPSITQERWWKNGIPHRFGGPANIDIGFEICQWYVNGKIIRYQYYICG